MFNEEVSLFNNIKSEPKTIKLFDWLDACINDQKFITDTGKYRSEIETLKSQGFDEAKIKEKLNQKGLSKFKKGLPLVTVGAVCEGGRSMSDVVRKTGWIALDIDGKDNPHLKDFKALRDEISKIIFVAFSALSVGGHGVWALVKIKEPDRQEDYFQQLLHDFKARGIFLDHTKGKNPNDARFYSYDPDAKIKRDFKIYDRLPTIPKQKLKALESITRTENVFELAEKVVREKYGHTFTHSRDMHNSLHQFCSFLNWKGVPRKETEEYIDKNLLSLSKITTNCISGPYEQTEFFGKGAQEQTINVKIDNGDGTYYTLNSTDQGQNSKRDSLEVNPGLAPKHKLKP